MKILALQLKRIGDAVLTAPVLAAVRQAVPGADLTLVLAGASGSLGQGFAMADRALTWRSGGLNAGLLWQIRSLRPDLVLDFTGNDRSAFLARLSGAPLRAGYARFATNALRRHAWSALSPASVRDLHTIDFHHALPAAAGLALPAVADAGHLTLPPDLTLPDDLPPRFAVVHPGTARAEKYWPAASWAEVIDHLQIQCGLPVILTGASDPDETAHLREIRSRVRQDVRSLAGQLSLLELAGLIARSRLALGVDTAAMHLASAFCIPQVVLYGPTNPWHWQPRHPAARVLCAGSPDDSPPGTRHTAAPMEALVPARVVRAVDSLLGGGA